VLKTEQPYRVNPTFLTQVQLCEEHGIPLAVVIGEEEIKIDIAKIRNIVTEAEVKYLCCSIIQI
jgi:histidyl-tRNA synthetase